MPPPPSNAVRDKSAAPAGAAVVAPEGHGPTPTPTVSSSGAAAMRARLLAHFERLRPMVVKPAKGFIKHPYCIPGGYYQQQWDWDGFFIACHLAARRPPQARYLKYWVLNALSAVLPDGDISACVGPGGARVAHPSLRLKPFLAQGAELGARLLDDYGWIEEHYEEIVRVSTRRETTHFIPEYGLYVWEDAMQSGADNNPAVGNDPEAAKSVAACDLNAFLHREYLALARLAARLGRHDDEAEFSTKAESLGQAVQSHLWDDEAETYWNLNVRTHQWCRRVSYSNFVPLWACMAPAEQARKMIRRYLWNDAHMLAPHGLRSLSFQDPEYNNASVIVPFSNWQGPVWLIANYFYFGALMRHGFRDEAAELVERLTRMLLLDLGSCGSMHENYCAETGRPLAPSAEHSVHGQEGGFIGWNLLLQDMIEMSEGRPNLLDLAD